MPRRDRLTYDVDVRRRRDVPVAPVLLLVSVVCVAAILVGWMVSSRTSRTQTTSAPPSALAASSTPVSTAKPTVSTGPTGSDADEAEAAPEGSQQAASRFVSAWLDRHPATRKASLQEVASPALAEQLMLTDVANIPVARMKGVPTLDDASTYSAEFTQPLSTGSSVRVYLVSDPQARYRWLATSVEQA